MNRRDILKGAGLLTLAASLPTSTIFAAESPSENRAAGHFKFVLGDLQMLVITDGHILISPPQPTFAPGIPKEKVTAALKDLFLSTVVLDGAINVLVIFKGSRIILIDTGSGALMGENSGRFLNNLISAGIHPDSVTDILITHLHIDHIGGILDTNGQKVFKNASYQLAKIEHDFWMADNPDFSKSKNPGSSEDSVRLAQTVVKNIKDQLQLFNFGDTLFGCIKTELAEGHTPGHPLLTIFSGNHELKHMVDAVHTPLLLAYPEWGAQWDTDFEKGVATRKRVLNQMAITRKLVMSCHLPWPGLGYIVKKDKGYGWVPMPVSTPQLYEK